MIKILIVVGIIGLICLVRENIMHREVMEYNQLDLANGLAEGIFLMLMIYMCEDKLKNIHPAIGIILIPVILFAFFCPLLLSKDADGEYTNFRRTFHAEYNVIIIVANIHFMDRLPMEYIIANAILGSIMTIKAILDR